MPKIRDTNFKVAIKFTKTSKCYAMKISRTHNGTIVTIHIVFNQTKYKLPYKQKY